MSELLYLRRLLAKRHVVDERTGCWEWQKGKRQRGYGSTFHDGRTRSAHRAYYEICVGPVPPGMVLDHLCRNTGCVNPDHLEPVTQRENVLRGTAPTAINARKTHCKRGHPLNDENVSDSDRRRHVRRCLVCRREAEYATRKVAA